MHLGREALVGADLAPPEHHLTTVLDEEPQHPVLERGHPGPVPALAHP